MAKIKKGVEMEGEKVPGGFHLCRATYPAADCNVGSAPFGDHYLGEEDKKTQKTQRQRHKQQTAMWAI